jgi:hypothetical protein
LIPTLVYLFLAQKVLKNLRLKSDKVLIYLVLGMATFSIAMIPALQFSGK